MAETRTVLKTYFEAGGTPNQTQFASLIDSLRHLWEDYPIIGVVRSTTTPATTTRNVAYIAATPGFYSGFGVTVDEGEVCLLKCTVNPATGVGAYSKETIFRTVRGLTGTFKLADLSSGMLTITYSVAIVRPLYIVVTLAAGGDTMICPVEKLSGTSCRANVGEVPTGTHFYDLVYFN